MNKGIIGRKIGMTQIFADDGRRIPVTVIQAGPCTVTQIKTKDRDGYEAVQLGYDPIPAHKTTRALVNHCVPSGKGPFRYFREFRGVSASSIGEDVTISLFAPGEYVDVQGTSKGKGFQGVIKRWNFKGGRASHGSCFHRAPGSIGSSATPSRVFKNKRLPGHMGNETVTVQRLQVIRVDSDQNLIMLKGAVPGPKNGIVLIKNTVKP